MLSSAHQDGIIKMWDIRQKQAANVVKSYQPRADAARDVQFDPFHEYMIAGTFENGNLIIWDRRMTDQPRIKLSAHMGSVQALAWNPCKEWQLATGGRDMSVRIWDVSGFVESSGPFSSLEPAGHLLASAQKPLWQLYTPCAVGRLAWRGLQSHPDQIASAAAADRGDIAVWKLGFKNIPACVVRGHRDDVCVGFAWLDTPIWVAESAKIDRRSEKPNGPKGRTAANHHIMSISKDGMVIIQDIRTGHFPRQHISRNVTATSARGHVAFQTSNILKV